MTDKIHILIVDDEQAMLSAIKRELRLHAPEYEVHSTANSNDALNMINEKNINILITDILMPEKDGIQLIREIQKDYENIKIITMSGGGRIDGETYLRLSKDLGATQSIKKPFTTKELILAIEHVISKTDIRHTSKL